MNRRNFLRTLAGGAAAAVAVRTFPFRVYSIPRTPSMYDGRLFWFGHDQGVWILNPAQAAAFEQLAHKVELADVEALQLEDLEADIPDLFSDKHAMYKSFYRDSINGIDYIESDVVGTINGLKRSKYPGRLAPNQRIDIRPAMKQLRGELDAAMQSDGEPLFRVPPGNAIRRKAELMLGDVFKEEDLVFRGIRDRVKDFVRTVKRA